MDVSSLEKLIWNFEVELNLSWICEGNSVLKGGMEVSLQCEVGGRESRKVAKVGMGSHSIENVGAVGLHYFCVVAAPYVRSVVVTLLIMLHS